MHTAIAKTLEFLAARPTAMVMGPHYTSEKEGAIGVEVLHDGAKRDRIRLRTAYKLGLLDKGWIEEVRFPRDHPYVRETGLTYRITAKGLKALQEASHRA